MGGKKRGSNRQKKRIQQANDELVDDQIVAADDAKMEAAADEDLFTIDVAPSKKKQKRIPKTTGSGGKFNKHILSDLEKRKVERLQKIHGDKIEEFAEESKKTAKDKRKGVKNVFDVWGDDDDNVVDGGRKKKTIDGRKKLPPSVPLEVAKSGQSYVGEAYRAREASETFEHP